MANKKLVIIAWRDLSNPEAGGAEVYATKVAEHFAQKGYSVTYLTSRTSDCPAEETKNGVLFKRMGNRFTIYFLLPLHFLLKEKKGADVLIENYNVWPFFVPILHRNSITIIHHLQQQEWVSEFGGIIGPILRSISYFLTRVLYSGNTVVTVSDSSKDEITDMNIKPSRLEIIHNGIDDSFFTNTLPEKPTDTIRLVSLGRLKKHKRVDLALKLISKAITEYGIENIQFDIMGRGDHEPELKQLAKKLNISDNVNFHGFVDEDTRLRLLQEGHLHFQFSAKEGWGITVMEAASQGVPTICFDVPGLRDSVKPDTGYIVPNGTDPKETFISALREIEANTPEAQNKRQNARDWAFKFSWGEILKKWDALLGETATA